MLGGADFSGAARCEEVGCKAGEGCIGALSAAPITNEDVLKNGEAIIESCKNLLANTGNSYYPDPPEPVGNRAGDRARQKSKIKWCDMSSDSSSCSCSGDCSAEACGDAVPTFIFGDRIPGASAQPKNGESLFHERIPNPFELKSVHGDVHSPYSAPLWFERDESAPQGYVGKRMPPCWWPSEFPNKTPENPLGFQGHSTRR